MTMVPGKVREASPPSPPSALYTDQQQRNPNNLLVGDNTNDFIRFSKKTRDLPNLSECHNCGYRINTTNGRDKLQILRSEWRVVLLCRKCVKLVNSVDLCPFCFSEALEKEVCFRCRHCSRRVHDHCVLKHKGFAPSAYYCCSPGSGFTVCLDCWLPEPLLKLRPPAGVKGGCRSRKVSKSGNGVLSLEKDCIKVLEDAAKEKVVAAAKARELAATKVVVARKAVKVANTALDLVFKRDDSSGNCAPNTAVDDAELAFRLHRALNSSRRISKNLCSDNSSCLAVRLTMFCNVKSSATAVSEFRGSQKNGKGNDGNCNVVVKSCSDKWINSSGDDNSFETESQSCSYGNENGRPNNIRSCSQSDCHMKTDRYYFKYSRRKSSSIATPRYTQSCGNEMQLNNILSHWQSVCDTKTDRYYFKYSKRNLSSKATPRYTQSCGNEMHLNNIRSHCQSDCDTKIDRYYFKYSKRKSSSKATPRCTQSCGNEMHPNRSHWQSDCDTETDRCHLKYSRRNSSLKETQRCRPKLLYEVSQLESQVSDRGSLQNCSKKRKTLSDAAPRQAYVCASGSLGDQR